MREALIQSKPRFDAYDSDAVTVARRLLGQRLVRIVDDERLAGTIVEVEAYLGEEDRAAHSFGGRRTPRNESMYLSGGHAYVYLIYGIHHCLNVVCGRAGEPVAVLIRAIEPTDGVDRMFRNRPAAQRAADLCSGPGKLAQALAIDRTQDGVDLRTSDALWIEQARSRAVAASKIVRGLRVGVDYAGEWAKRPLRFSLKENSHVSR